MKCPECGGVVNLLGKKSYCSKCGMEFRLGEDVSFLINSLIDSEEEI